MVTSFKSIFQVNLLHNFYTDGKCSDFVLFPLNETIDLLRNRQAVFRSKDNYIRTLILGDSSGPGAAVPLEKNESCYFGMRLITPSFSNITNEYPSDKKIFLFTNENNTSDPSAAAIALERKEIALCGPVINHTVVSAAGVTLKLKNVSGQVIQTKNYAAGSAGTNHQFDIQRLPKGLYTVTEDDGATTIYTYYADNDLVFDSVFGIIRIVNQPDFLFTYDGKPIYQVSFTSRSSLWNYYVVAPGLSGSDIKNHLTIHDAGRTGAAKITFDKTYPVPASDTMAPLLCSDTSKIALFTSGVSLDWQQTPRKRIELRKSGTTLIDDLPNPDQRKPGTTIYVYV